jgi:lipopolysaccharide heptosyltransferase II
MLHTVDDTRILIIKPSSLGDIVLALPALAALRDRFPRAHIAWLVKKQWAGLLERVEGLDAVWPVDGGPGGWLSVIPRLRAERFDVVLDLQGLFRSGLLAWLTGCTTRIGFVDGREGSTLFYTQTVPVRIPDMHAVDRYLRAAAALGAAADKGAEFRFRLASEDRDAVDRLLSARGLPAGAAWIAVSSAARWPTKRWPPASFAAVLDRLQQEGLGRVVLIGGAEERHEAQGLKRLMRTEPVDLTGETTLQLLPALLRSASLLLTNDSGPMHIAAAVGTSVVALFGPTSPALTGPYGTEHRALTSPVPCSPCFSRRCRNPVQLECLRNLSPEYVLEAVRGQLALSGAR